MEKSYLCSMLKFDSNGLLTPYRPIPCQVKDLKTHFVDSFDSETRPKNFDKYIRYSNEIKALLRGIEVKQWVNGSFVTKKINPKDIDVISFVSHTLVKELGDKLYPFRPEGSWDVFGIDAYVLEVHAVGSRYHFYTQSDTAYWREQFGHTKPNKKGIKKEKGFLEIIC